MARLPFAVLAAAVCALVSAPAASAAALADSGHGSGHHHDRGWSRSAHDPGRADRPGAAPARDERRGDDSAAGRGHRGDCRDRHHPKQPTGTPAAGGHAAADVALVRVSTPARTTGTQPSTGAAPSPEVSAGAAAASTTAGSATPAPTTAPATEAQRMLVAPRPRPTAKVGLVADTTRSDASSSPGLGQVALYGEIAAGALALVLGAAAVALWRHERNTP